jgi:hypothetical protein
VAFGAYGGAMSAKLSTPPLKKKKGLFDDTSDTAGGDTGDDSVDAAGDDLGNVDSGMPTKSVNAKPESQIARGTKEVADSGDSEGPSDIGDEGEGKELGSYDAVEDDAASELASTLGVSDDKMEAFKSALSDYVAACVRKSKT